MTSIIKVDQIQNAAGGTPTAADLGLNVSGSVLQVKQTVMTSEAVINSTSFTEVLALTTSITPSSTSSKILVDVNVNVGGFGHYDLKLQANGSDILIGDAVGSRTRSTYHAYHSSTYNTTYDIESVSIKFLHSPSTTSPVTYRIVGGSPYSSSYYVLINREYNDQDDTYQARTASTMTLTEIAG